MVYERDVERDRDSWQRGLQKFYARDVELDVLLFFGEWREEDIASARMMMGAYTTSERSGIWESGP
ncbi:hypothetical protein BT69DRAFT_1287716 [Atractiella rhizophila]|nr:hypothetical protein BT69DRAFT_1287716 [Atractiella rhizophila]